MHGSWFKDEKVWIGSSLRSAKYGSLLVLETSVRGSEVVVGDSMAVVVVGGGR
jgi:hypothetical protein